MKTGPKYKICKRLGGGVFEKCQTQKFALSEARSGKTRGKRGGMRALSDFGRQLLEKQKVRFTYGVSEKQLSRYIKESTQKKGGTPVEMLLGHLEARLDNVVYRLGLAATRAFARQMVSHGHITVNGRKVTIPSYRVSAGDVIGVREGSKGKTLFADVGSRLKEHKTPAWIALDAAEVRGEIKGTPGTENTDTLFNLAAVLEYYSR